MEQNEPLILKKNIFNIGSLVFYITLYLILGFRVYAHLQTPTHRDQDMHWGMIDFQTATYYPVLAMLEGVNPYDEKSYRKTYPVPVDFSAYSPFSLILHSPFGLPSFESANISFIIFNGLLFPAFALIVIIVCGGQPSMWKVFGLASAVLMTRPGFLVALNGQIVCEVAIGCLVALHYSRSRPVVAGLGLALACLKPTFGVPVALLMLARRDWRSVGVGAAVSAVGAAAGVLIISAKTGGLGAFFAVLTRQYIGIEGAPGIPAAHHVYRIDAISAIARIFDWYPGSIFSFIYFVFVMSITAIAVYYLTRNIENVLNWELSKILIVLATMTAIYHMWYDALLLVFPFVFVVLNVLKNNAARRSPMAWIFIGLVGVLLFNFSMTNSCRSLFDLQGYRLAVVSASNGLALMLAWMIAVGVSFSRVRAETTT